MSSRQLMRIIAAEMDRRAFISVAGRGAIAGASGLLLASACGRGGADVVAPPPPSQGFLRGTVVDMNGYPQAVGRLFLLTKSGLNNGSYVDVDDMGVFDFGAVPTGEYQLLYWGANLAHVPEPLVNPVPIAVRNDEPTVVTIRIVTAEDEASQDRDINIGDYFFQEQPSGALNAGVTVTKGTWLCWYNVGVMLHTVTGGPWGDSGPLAHGENFRWQTTEVGTFPYRCSYHGTRMLSNIIVVP